MAEASRAREPLFVLLLLALAGVLLHVPTAHVPLLHDMLGYSGQALSLIEGHGNTIGMGATRLPGVYPAGVPLLASLPMRILGPDLRHGALAILGCSLLALACVYATARRCGGPAAATTALLLLLCSPLYRSLSGHILSEVPTALAIALASLLFLSRESRLALGAAGLLATVSLLLRYANIFFPAAMLATEVLFGALRPRSRVQSLAWLCGGMGLGAVVVALHNAWAFGSPLATGYSHWGWDAGETWSLHNFWSAPGNPNAPQPDLLSQNFLGFGRLQSLPMLLAAAWGVVAGWRHGGRARLLAGLGVIVVAAQYAFLAGFPFRYEAYLVPTLPLVAALGGLGAAAVLRGRWQWMAPVGAAALIVVSVARQEDPPLAEQEAIQHRDALAALGGLAERDAALLTTADPAMVEPLFRRSGRTVLYLGPYISPLVEQAALAELGAHEFTSRLVVRYADEMLAHGRPVYFDENPPPRGSLPLHAQVRKALMKQFDREVTAAQLVYRLAPLKSATSPDEPPSGK